MPHTSRSTATRQGSHRQAGDEYATTRSPDNVPSVSARVPTAGAWHDLQSTMGNSFVSRASTGGVPAAPAGVPAAPEGEDDWWDFGGSSEPETPAPQPQTTDTDSEEGTGYGTRQPDEQDPGSQWTAGSGGGGTNQMSPEDTPGAAGVGFTDESDDSGGDAGGGY